ncbi:MAG: hypothetical protein ACLFPP_05590 [Spirochaetaceae bacterium]
MTTMILLLQLWSVTAALIWLRAIRLAARQIDPAGVRRPGFGTGYLLGGSFGALVVFLLALGRPLPWLILDVYRPEGSVVATFLFEELFKWGILLLGLYGAEATESRREGMEHAALVSIGFALTQNSFYFIRYPDLSVVLRPLLFAGAEAAAAAIWGYATTGFYLRRRGTKPFTVAAAGRPDRLPLSVPSRLDTTAGVRFRNGSRRPG